MYHGKFNSIISRNGISVIAFLVLIFALFAFSSFAGPDSRKSSQDLQKLLTSISSDSLSEQTAALQNFIEGHPQNYRAYSFLLERFLLQDKISEAKSYFQALARLPSHQQDSYWMLARIYDYLKETENAHDHYWKALQPGNPPLLLLEDFFAFVNRHPESFQDSDRNLQSLKEMNPIASAIFNYTQSNYNKAIEEFAQISKKTSLELQILKIYGDCYYRLSDYESADLHWEKGRELSRKLDDFQYEAHFLYQFGLICHSLRKYKKAVSYYDSAYVIASHIGDFQLIQLLEGYRGNILKNMGRYKEALDKYQSAIEIGQKLNPNLAKWYFGYGETFFYLDRFQDALEAYDSAKRIAVENGDQGMIVKIENNKGDIYTYLQLHSLARKVYQQAYELAETNGLKDKQDDSMVGLAAAMIDEGKYAEAVEIYRSFVEKTSNSLWKAYCHGQIAKIHILEKKYALAREHFVKSLEASQERNYGLYIGGSLIGLAKIDLLTNSIDDAIEKYHSAYDVAEEIAAAEGDSSLIIDVYNGLGDAYMKSGNLNKSITAYRNAATLIEASREKLKVEQFRIGYFSTASQTYKKLVNCYYERFLIKRKRTDLDSLFYYEEMARARGLKDIKFRKAQTKHQPLDNEAYEEYKNLGNQLRSQQRYLRTKAKEINRDEEWDSLYTSLDITRNLLISRRLRLIEETPASFSEKKIPSLQTVLENLQDEGLGLLLYHINEETSFVLAAAGNKMKLISLATNPEELKSAIISLVNPFHNADARSTPSTPFRAEIAHQLYQLLIKPVEDSLTLPQQLVIVPDIALLSLPFEMLLTKVPDKTEYNLMDKPVYAGDFLLHRYSVIYSPTTYLLLKESKDYSAHPNILVFSNPFKRSSLAAQNRSIGQLGSRQGWRFDPLPFAEKEALKIKEAFSWTKVYKRDEATKAAFFEKAPEYEIIHIATHGFVDTTFDAFSGLVLATTDDPNDDGLIMGYEIADKRLNCDLITLSACETGLGKKVAGEGVLGLPRQFLSAGAKSVLMTLWKVDDQFTSELMPDFYRLYLQEELSKPNALAEAKREILSREISAGGVYYQHPFFWASFNLFGSPGNNLKIQSGTKWNTYLVPSLGVAAFITLIILSIRILGRKSADKT